MLPTADLDYHLPEELIAITPAQPRDAARLMVVWRSAPQRIEHRLVRDLPQILSPADLLVINTTKVIPARFRGVRTDSGGHVEGLYLGHPPTPPTPPTSATSAVAGAPSDEAWSVLIRSRRQAPGVRIRLNDRAGHPSNVTLELLGRDETEPGAWVVRVDAPDVPAAPGTSQPSVLERVGLTPLPPYILQARKHAGFTEHDEQDRAAYQTIFADDRHAQSVAAPTAGLHFTPGLLDRLERAGVRRTSVVLHVGTGTFKPIDTEFVEQHAMHEEWCQVSVEAGRMIAAALSASRDAGRAPRGRVIAVGTTAARTLESFGSLHELAAGGTRATRLLITPGHTFRHLDALLTNFHLPRSTLMALVAAMFGPRGGRGGGEEAVARLKGLYRQAIEARYRFYSFGDAMLILP